MGNLKAKDFISTLMNTGADAYSNLFRATLTFKETAVPRLEGATASDMSFRIIGFPQTPSRDVVTQDISYMGISVSIPVFGSTLKRSGTFVIRVDEDYLVYDRLRDLQCVTDDGVFHKFDINKFNLKIEVFRPSQDTSSIYDYCCIYEWNFYDCYITTVSPVAYNYDSSNAVTATVGFIYKSFNGTPIKGDSSITRITPEGMVQGGISDLRDLLQTGVNILPSF